MFKKYIFLTSVLFFTISTHIFSIGPDAIKDTYNPVAPEFRHVSPIQGAMWWEGYVLQKYYEFGIQQPKANKNDWLPGGDGPIRLIHGLFNIVQGSFGISQNPSYPAYHLSSRTIGSIIAALEKDRLAEKQTLTVSTIENLILNDPDFKASIENTRKKYAETKDAKYDVSRLGLSFQTGKRIRKGAGFQRLHELSEAIVDAYKASTEIYPPYCVYSILTGFMYRKASSKNDFLNYFKVLNKELKTTVFPTAVINAPEEWLNSHYSKIDTLNIKIILTEWASNSQPEIQLLSNKFYEDAVYGQIIHRFYTGDLPKIARYDTVEFQGNGFSDCAETAMRNICNIILYDKGTSSFDLAKSPKESVDPAFAVYFQKNKNALNVEQHNTHQEWTDIIANIPWVAYNRKINNKKLVTKASSETNGYIILPKDVLEKLEKVDNKVKIANRWYIPIDGANEKGFEVQPSIRNIIVLLNHFFDLKLFNNINEDFLKDDFNATYLPETLSKFDRLEGYSFDKNSIDNQDYTKDSIKIHFDQFSLKTNLGHAELTIPTTTESFINLSQILVNTINEQQEIFANFPYTQLFSIYPLSNYQFIEIKSIPTFPLIYFLDLFNNNTRAKLFSHLLSKEFATTENKSVLNARKELSLILLNLLGQQADNWYFKEALKNLPQPMDPDAIKIIKQIIDKALEENRISHAAETFIFLLKNSDFQPTKEEVNKIASIILKSDDASLQTIGFQLFDELVERDFKTAFEQATEFATIQSKINGKLALNLFLILVTKDHSFNEAAQAAKIGLENPQATDNSIKIFAELIKRNQGFPEATDAAVILAQDQIFREKGIRLLASLAQKGQAYDEAIKVVQEAGYINADILELLTNLVEKKQAYPEALAAIKRTYGNELLVIKLLNALLNEQQGYIEAMNAAKNNLHSSNDAINNASKELLFRLINLDLQTFQTLIKQSPATVASIAWETLILSKQKDLQKKALELFMLLLENGHGHAKASSAASFAIRQPDIELQEMGLNLFAKLFKENARFDDAEYAARQAVNDNTTMLTGLKLYTLLVNNEKEYQFAAKAAEKALKSEDENIQKAGLDLLTALVAHQQETFLAEKVIPYAIASENKEIQKSGIQLFEALLKNDRDISSNLVNSFTELAREGEAYPEAILAAQKAMRSSNDLTAKAGLQLFENLVTQKVAYIQAAEAAQFAMDRVLTVKDALKLFSLLVNEGQAYNLAIKAAQKAISNKSSFVREEAFNLFKLLVNKNQAYKEATEAAKVLLNDTFLKKQGEELLQLVEEKEKGTEQK